MQSKVLATPLTLGIQISRRVEGERGLDCWMNQMTPMSPLLPLLSLVIGLSDSCLSRPPDIQHQSQPLKAHWFNLCTWYVRHFVDWGDVMWGFNATTCELNLCLLGACSPRPPPTSTIFYTPSPHPIPHGCSEPSGLAACPDTLGVVSCHCNDVTRRSDSQGLLLKVIVSAKEKPSPRINGHWTACEQRDKNGWEKIN